MVRVLKYVLRHPANRGHRARALARFGVWLLVRRFGRSPRTIRWVEGRRLRWYPDSVSVGNAWLCGLLEYADMRFVRDVLRPGDLFVDVGANVGVYTLLATLTPDVDVLAFEPGGPARSRLAEHVALNGIDRVTISPLALSDSTREVAFTTGQDVLNRVAAGGGAGTETVPAARLDDVLPADAFERPVMLKIDAEGHDAQVLRGAAGLLKRAHPVVIVEWQDDEVRAVLEPLGYAPHTYEPDSRRLTASGWRRTSTSNVLAIADPEAVRERLGPNGSGAVATPAAGDARAAS